MAENSKITVTKAGFKCHSCGKVLNRKDTEPFPHSCSYCHNPGAKFTKVVVTYGG